MPGSKPTSKKRKNPVEQAKKPTVNSNQQARVKKQPVGRINALSAGQSSEPAHITTPSLEVQTRAHDYSDFGPSDTKEEPDPLSPGRRLVTEYQPIWISRNPKNRLERAYLLRAAASDPTINTWRKSIARSPIEMVDQTLIDLPASAPAQIPGQASAQAPAQAPAPAQLPAPAPAQTPAPTPATANAADPDNNNNEETGISFTINQINDLLEYKQKFDTASTANSKIDACCNTLGHDKNYLTLENVQQVTDLAQAAGIEIHPDQLRGEYQKDKEWTGKADAAYKYK